MGFTGIEGVVVTVAVQFPNPGHVRAKNDLIPCVSKCRGMREPLEMSPEIRYDRGPGKVGEDLL